MIYHGYTEQVTAEFDLVSYCYMQRASIQNLEHQIYLICYRYQALSGW